MLYIKHSVLTFIKKLAVGLAVGLAFYIGYFHLCFYPFYYSFKLNFATSPYHYDSVIWLPIWRAKQRFCLLATDDPQTAYKFVNFLRTYRPLQEKLADYIYHAAHASVWKQQPLAFENTLKAPFIENQKLKPSED